MLFAVIIVAVWLACARLAYAIYLYDFSVRFPWADNRDRVFAFVVTVTGPIALLVVLLAVDRYGLRFKPMTVEERWQAHQKRFPFLGREYFDGERS